MRADSRKLTKICCQLCAIATLHFLHTSCTATPLIAPEPGLTFRTTYSNGKTHLRNPRCHNLEEVKVWERYWRRAYYVRSHRGNAPMPD
ncbi:hypothetical protein F5141DRAFT_1151971 [Pisolithus sp. B1]|nr:hypothetical protein F5141DRAFT_1151971 [Pisolithus sp. B1]